MSPVQDQQQNKEYVQMITVKKAISRIMFPSMNNLMVVFANKLGVGIAFVFLLVLSGCSRCQDCEQNNSTETICETEFDNSEQYEDAIADAEADGAVCVSSGGF